MSAQGCGPGSRRAKALAGLAVAVSALALGAPLAQGGSGHAPAGRNPHTLTPAAAPFRPGVVLIGFTPGVSSARQHAIERAAGVASAARVGPAIRRSRSRVKRRALLTPLLLKVASTGVLAAVRRLRSEAGVAYAEPDYLMQASAAPNDPSFALQWGDSNTGQSLPAQNANEELGSPASGTPGADDRALAAWGVSTGSRSIVIGETDTGVNYNHADLQGNVWSNPGGIGGCAAGTHGYNVLSSTCEPMDDDNLYGGHGTHVAGIMGAVGNNGVGVAGMNWQTSILPVKWLNSEAWGSTSGLIAALQWLVAAKQAGVNIRVVNDSATFLGTSFSRALSEEIDTLGANNILFVTAAGNTANNNDEEAVRRYPCGYDRPTEICVTASNNKDELPSWANFGPHTVNLAAPGVSIYSTLRNGSYGYLSGGSMASPQVAGAAALILSVKPALSASELRADILENVDKLPSLEGKVTTGGRLDVCKAMPGCATKEAPPPAATFGKSSVGASSDSGIFADYKVVHAATLPAAGTVTKLSLYAIPGLNSPSPQALRGVIYADSGGSPGALVAVGTEVSYRGDVNGSGWFELPLDVPVRLSPGTYWLGFITGAATEGLGYAYDSVAGGRAYNANTLAGGPSNPFGSATKDSEQASIYATYTPPLPQVAPPVNTGSPSISGTAQTGQTLASTSGSWSESPSSFAYQWQRCNATGASCTPISSATAQAYTLGSADVGVTVRVAVTTSNSAGSSTPANSGQTAVIQQGVATIGKTSVGASADSYAANRKRVSRYALATAGTLTKLSTYLAAAGVSGAQALEGVVYADAAGKPGALVGVTEPLTFKSTSSAGWYGLAFSSPLKLSAGNYWIGLITGSSPGVAGFRYDSIAGSRDYNANTFTSGPTNPFGAASSDGEQASLYATYLAG
jgi:subtilisin family serine protease